VTIAPPAPPENTWFLDAKRPSIAAEWSGKTVDLGLRKPCRCGSGKKFKACCMSREELGKGWILLDAESRMPLGFDFSHVSDIYKDAFAILVFETYEKADNYVRTQDMVRNTAGKLACVRILVEGLASHIEQTFPADSPLLLVLPFGVSNDPAGEVIRIDPVGVSVRDQLAQAGLVEGQDFVLGVPPEAVR